MHVVAQGLVRAQERQHAIRVRCAVDGTVRADVMGDGLAADRVRGGDLSGTVHQRSPGAYPRRLRTVATPGERQSAVLESVLGATPREFESRILRHADPRKYRPRQVQVPMAGHQLIPSATDAQRAEYAAQLRYALLQLLDGCSEREVRGSRELACNDRD